MDGFIRRFVIALCVLGLYTGCASSPSTSQSDSEFADLDKASSSDTTTTDNSSSEDALEKEMNSTQEAAPPVQAQSESLDSAEPTKSGGDDFAAFDEPPKDQAAKQVPPPEVIQEQPAPVPEEAPAPVVDNSPPPTVEEPTPVAAAEPPAQVASSERPAQIRRILYKANDSGGTVAIEADKELTFTTRVNANTNQFVIEIPNAKLSAKARRSLNTRDFAGSIGAIDPYQGPGSTTARIVIQLRPNSAEPVVQAEGNMLLVVSSKLEAATPPPAQVAATATEGEEEAGTGESGQETKVFSSGSLDEFLGSNQKFYGKKISIEVNDAEISDIFKFLSEESGVNFVIADDVKGKISIKLKQVPWDQALVVIMKSKKLGYQRSGQVLRIAKMADLKQEEEDFSKVAKAKQTTLPIEVKIIPVSYAKVDDLLKQISPFLSERGKAIAESRTSAIVISDIQEVIERIKKLIISLDVAPSQVLIEGKVVEARETFQRFIGVNWTTTGDSIDLGSASRGRKISSNMGQHTVAAGATSGIGTFNFSIGTLDFLGDFSASLGLSEQTGDVKVLSSPRILTLHNEPAEISQVSQLPIVTSTISGSIVTPKVDYKNVNLKLSVTPQITNDASVILAVDVMREFAGELAEQTTGARAINSRAAKTKVIVKNGQTAVIGGIYQNDATDSENKVPLLGDIPVLGWLFKNKTTTNEKNELLIFLTPRIVAQADSGVSAPPSIPAVESPTTSTGPQDGQLKSDSSQSGEPSSGGLEL